uniref:Uncharacterized protein n=1 Tax=Oryza barthii TaxID=65489 RepID=A0A0D3HNW8_9ORYZ
MSTVTNVTEDWKKGLAEVLDRLDSIWGKLSGLDNQQQSHHIGRTEQEGKEEEQKSTRHFGCGSHAY